MKSDIHFLLIFISTLEKFESNQGPDRIKNALVEESPWLLKTTYVEQESREIATGVNAEQVCYLGNILYFILNL